MSNHQNKETIDTIAGECVAVRLRMLNRAVTNFYDDALRPLNLRVSQMNILVATAKMGIARPAILCNALNMDVSTLSRNVDRMKANGWLEVIADEDGRAQPFQLTKVGNRLLENAVPAWENAQEQAKTLLGNEIVHHLDQAVARLHA